MKLEPQHLPGGEIVEPVVANKGSAPDVLAVRLRLTWRIDRLLLGVDGGIMKLFSSTERGLSPR